TSVHDKAEHFIQSTRSKLIRENRSQTEIQDLYLFDFGQFRQQSNIISLHQLICEFHMLRRLWKMENPPETREKRESREQEKKRTQSEKQKSQEKQDLLSPLPHFRCILAIP